MKKIFILAAVMSVAVFISCSQKTNPAAPVTGTPTQTISANTPTATASVTASLTPVITCTDLVSVPGGTFIQNDWSTGFSHTVSAFKIGKYQVTYDLWYTVYQWAIVNGYTFQNAGLEGFGWTLGAPPTAAKNEPVTAVNWRDAIVWCNAFSQKTGLPAVYCSDAGFTGPIKDSRSGSYASSTDTTPGSFDNPYVNWASNGYRLPTEGEYQYAASYIDGSNWTPHENASGATADTSDLTATAAVAYWDDCFCSAENVGKKAANALGIYDMSGNIYEWCWDWSDNYPGTSTDYRGPSNGYLRVARGGYIGLGGPGGMEVGSRNAIAVWGTHYTSGFRFARTY